MFVKTCIFFVLLVSASSKSAKLTLDDVEPVDEGNIQPFLLEQQINETFIFVSQVLSEFDPFYRAEKTVISDDPNFLLSVSNTLAVGFSDFVASYLKFSLNGLQFNFTLNVPRVYINSEYSLDALLWFVPLYGHGVTNLEITDIVLTGSANANLVGLHVNISDIELYLAVGNITLQMSGMLDDPDFSDLFSSAVTDLLAKFINDYPHVVSAVISPIVEGVINYILGAAQGPTIIEQPTSPIESPPFGIKIPVINF